MLHDTQNTLEGNFKDLKALPVSADVEASIQAQLALEEYNLVAGAERYLDRQDRKGRSEGVDARDDAQKVIKAAIPLVSSQITKWCEEAGKSAGRTHRALKFLNALDPDLLALIGLRSVFLGVGRGGHMVDVTITTGTDVQMELEALALKEHDPKAAKLFASLAAKGTESANTKRHNALTEKAGVALNWGGEEKLRAGEPIVNAVLIACEALFERSVGYTPSTHASAKIEKESTIVLTDAGAAALVELAEAEAWMHPLLTPMIAIPRPWESNNTGAYYDERLAKRVKLVRGRSSQQKKLIAQAVKDGTFNDLLAAVNAAQETAWSIDTRVLEIVEWTKEAGLRPSSSFPLTNLPVMPAKVSADVWDAADKTARSVWSSSRRAVRLEIKDAASASSVFNSDIQIAKMLAEAGTFYQPHSLDWRGRIYPVAHFNHQRGDHIKGMFRFADGVALGETGGDWLAIHIANCGDFGKVSKATLDKRIAWTYENGEMLLEIAADPRGTYDKWSAADAPFCFLQACFEYAAWAETGFSEDFQSSIPIALDGSCSGLQHYSAITRSPEEARHVNLVPRDDVGDIHTFVVGIAQDLFEKSIADGDQMAKICIDAGFGRPTVKRNVMTYFYGSNQFGMSGQHMEDLMRPLTKRLVLGEIDKHPYSVINEKTGLDDGGFAAAACLAKHIYKAVTTAAPRAEYAARWFQSVAAILAHEALPVVWTSPMGLPVVQLYQQYESKRVAMWLYDRAVPVVTHADDKADQDGNVLTKVRTVLQTTATKLIDKSKARSAIAPNVIHSLDAAHMLRTVLMAMAKGIKSFCLIHDSFATHAGNTGKFAWTIKEAFVAQYETYCPMKAIDAYARSVLSEEGIAKLPAIEPLGTLDLNEVMGAMYAFA
ncbi:hypothetical protein EUV02_03765 [Polymorphobacter arshaanensis]|uniref:DNA-directed RNA polymerase n=1 Tax=Glacieibacterium arshaanense TaxID=2511025 RepID=A0A4Y9ES16_9SPHN|nr:DNA-directed RNA polymerase [Polymorphobacter arshaanensis]TFU06140.1 hypothetical protein EUV02_03765 [Polymorphobacter arshaanensis]